MSLLRAHIALATSGLPTHEHAHPIRVSISIVEPSTKTETAAETWTMCPPILDTRRWHDAAEHHGIDIREVWDAPPAAEIVQRIRAFLLRYGQPAIVCWSKPFGRSMSERMDLDYPYWVAEDVQTVVRRQLGGRIPSMETALAALDLPPRVRGDTLRDARLSALMWSGG